MAGLREADFWEMTVGECARVMDSHKERRKDQAYFSYSTALATGLFIGSMFGGSPPKISDVYPELFPKDEEVEEESKDASSMANFINFANAFNKDFDNGDRKSESENNS